MVFTKYGSPDLQESDESVLEKKLGEVDEQPPAGDALDDEPGEPTEE